MAAKLDIEFEGDVLGNGYYLGATVLSAEEVPSRSLIFQRGTKSQRERLVRVATMDDLDLPETSAPHDLFRGASLQTKDWVWPPATGYVHRIALFYLDVTHPEWIKLGSPVLFVSDVATILGDNVVQVVTPFPAFGNSLHYRHLYFNPTSGPFPVITPGQKYPQDGIADRQYPDDPSIYYRTHSAFAILDNLAAAENRKTSLEAEAQSLVDGVNATYPTYAGDDTYNYS